MKNIPFVDLDQYRMGGKSDKHLFIDQLAKAFHEVGFVGIRNHGIPEELIDRFYREAKQFFDLPESIKRRYEIEGLAGQRGYTSFGREHAKHSDVADLKEFFQIGQEYPAAEEPASDYPPNVAVAECPQFLPTALSLYQAFERTGNFLLEAIANHLSLPDTYFARRTEGGNSILRAIHYPPIIKEPASAIRAEQHEDINLITLLVGASAAGLQVLDKEGDWVPVVTQKNEIVVNVGDMLQRLTNNYLKSTTHRVVNPPREEWHLPRLSIPFFLHPISTMDLSCLSSCVPNGQSAAYDSITASEYLNERLREIGLKK